MSSSIKVKPASLCGLTWRILFSLPVSLTAPPIPSQGWEELRCEGMDNDSMQYVCLSCPGEDDGQGIDLQGLSAGGKSKKTFIVRAHTTIFVDQRQFL